MSERSGPGKDAEAFRTIGEVAEDLHVPQHVLRFWETRFAQIKPLKRAGGRRFYRPEDVALLRAVQTLLYAEGYTIKGVQRLLEEFGAAHVAGALARSTRAGPVADPDGPGRGPVSEGTLAALPATAAGRREPPVGPAPAAPARSGRAAAGGPPDADIVARLEGVLADLSECRRLMSSVCSIKG